jgi:hypothetical protein
MSVICISVVVVIIICCFSCVVIFVFVSIRLLNRNYQTVQPVRSCGRKPLLIGWAWYLSWTDMINLEVFLGNDENLYEYIFVYYLWIYLLLFVIFCFFVLLLKAFNALDWKYMLNEFIL